MKKIDMNYITSSLAESGKLVIYYPGEKFWGVKEEIVPPGHIGISSHLNGGHGPKVWRIDPPSKAVIKFLRGREVVEK